MVRVNDQIVEVDGRSLHGYTNQEAVEMLRATGNTVRCSLFEISFAYRNSVNEVVRSVVRCFHP
jgi:C-terminal processing protease CtpA/Prc